MLGVLVDEQKVEPILQNSHIDITLRVKKKKYYLEFLLKSRWVVNVFISLKRIHQL